MNGSLILQSIELRKQVTELVLVLHVGRNGGFSNPNGVVETLLADQNIHVAENRFGAGGRNFRGNLERLFRLGSLAVVKQQRRLLRRHFAVGHANVLGVRGRGVREQFLGARSPIID